MRKEISTPDLLPLALPSNAVTGTDPAPMESFLVPGATVAHGDVALTIDSYANGVVQAYDLSGHRVSFEV
jgi:hypothetical protein